jgi:hypothetical protein
LKAQILYCIYSYRTCFCFGTQWGY